MVLVVFLLRRVRRGSCLGCAWENLLLVAGIAGGWCCPEEVGSATVGASPWRQHESGVSAAPGTTVS